MYKYEEFARLARDYAGSKYLKVPQNSLNYIEQSNNLRQLKMFIQEWPINNTINESVYNYTYIYIYMYILYMYIRT